MPYKKLTVNVSPEVYAELRAIAGDSRTNKSDVIRGALIQYIHGYRVANIVSIPPHPEGAQIVPVIEVTK